MSRSKCKEILFTPRLLFAMDFNTDTKSSDRPINCDTKINSGITECNSLTRSFSPFPSLFFWSGFFCHTPTDCQGVLHSLYIIAKREMGAWLVMFSNPNLNEFWNLNLFYQPKVCKKGRNVSIYKRFFQLIRQVVAHAGIGFSRGD